MDPMKILLLADEADPMLWEYLDKRRLDGVELVLSCGDLPPEYLSFLSCFTAAPIVYVHGNHDTKYAVKPPEGCLCAEDDILRVEGVRILGLGGSMRYRPGDHQYTEAEMTKRIQKLRWKLWRSGGFDILLTHSPMRGLGDMEDLPHRGFACFEPLLQKYKPALFAFAHVHASYSARFQRLYTFGETQAVNAWKSYVIDLPELGKKTI